MQPILTGGIALLILAVCIGGIGWAFGWFDWQYVEVYEWVPGRETPIVRLISRNGTKAIDEFLEMDVDRITLAGDR